MFSVSRCIVNQAIDDVCSLSSLASCSSLSLPFNEETPLEEQSHQAPYLSYPCNVPSTIIIQPPPPEDCYRPSKKLKGLRDIQPLRLLSTFSMSADDHLNFEPDGGMLSALYQQQQERDHRHQVHYQQDLYHCSRPQQQQPAPVAQQSKRPPSLLHHVCCRSYVSVANVLTILAADPTSLHRAVVLRSNTKPSSSGKKASRQPYTYPLNLAIHHGADANVIRLLLQAEPRIALWRDGAQEETSLHILLQQDRPDLDSLVDEFCKANPAAVQMLDARDQVPLHVIVSHKAELAVVRRLCLAFPQSLSLRARCGKTPVELAAVRDVACCNKVADYLFQYTALMQEGRQDSFDDSGI